MALLPARVDAYLIVGGRYHDIDFVRSQLLNLLGEHPRIRTLVAGDYRDIEAIERADLLLTYTVDVMPDEETANRLNRWVASGKRWFALHGTNSVLKWSKQDKAWTAPRVVPTLMQTLGSQFLAHPPIAPYRVEVTDPSHPLVAGIEAFSADDELYLSALHPPIEVLLQTRWTGETPLFVDSDWTQDEPRPVLYLKQVGSGSVLYFTLGHARGQYDMRPLMEEYPTVERGSWNTPAFIELLRRGICWAMPTSSQS
ncbi:MAG: ThuA domain-containing protein [Gammaproteobacteria bacterium]|nr:ThuA domain-containing protein [Gammaproteobacteria bacterium]